MKMGSYGLKQVIFLIDTTASVAPYWADLKKYYIFPIINFFNNSEVPTKGKSCDSAFSNRIFKGSSDQGSKSRKKSCTIKKIGTKSCTRKIVHDFFA